ncbi:MAG: hypothetical protein ABIK09_03795 [Pseudomonadota bacterium]
MTNLTKSLFRPASSQLLLALSILAVAPGCDSQGETYIPPDSVVGETVISDGSLDEASTGADMGPGWDWWSGDLLAWRAEQIPLKEVFHGISGVDDGDGYAVYVVGFRGAVLQYHSAVGEWTDVSPATSRSVEGVWALGPERVWICGEQGLLMRYEAPAGASYPEWNDETDPLRTETVNSIHGTGPDDIWAVGDDALILHRTAAGWEEFPKTALGWPAGDERDLFMVWAAAPDHVFVGGEGYFGFWDGAEWKTIWSSADSYLAVAASGDTIWLGTDGGYLWSYDGEIWVKQAAPVYYDYNAIWVAEDGRVFATGEDPSPQSIIWIGKKEPWEQLEVISPEGVAEQWAITENSLITGLWGRDPEDLFVCTQQQQILRYSKHP